MLTEKILELVNRGYEVAFMPGMHAGTLDELCIELRYEGHKITDTITMVCTSCDPETLIERVLDRGYRRIEFYKKEQEGDHV